MTSTPEEKEDWLQAITQAASAPAASAQPLPLTSAVLGKKPLALPLADHVRLLHLHFITNFAQVRTLFISGLPPDVREREIHQMFRIVRCYEARLIPAIACRLTHSFSAAESMLARRLSRLWPFQIGKQP